WKGLGYRASSTTTHPAFIAARRRNPLWRLTRAPSLAGGSGKFKHATTRLTAGFEYIRPPVEHVKMQPIFQGWPYHDDSNQRMHEVRQTMSILRSKWFFFCVFSPAFVVWSVWLLGKPGLLFVPLVLIATLIHERATKRWQEL